MTAIFPKLEGLDSLARRDGVDIRPTLLRVLTDLYVQKPAHSAEEERHYTELALRLIDSVDLADPRRGREEDRRLCGRAAGGRAAARARRDRGRRADPAPLPGSHAPPISTSIVRDFGWAHAAIIATKREHAAAEPQVTPRAPAARRGPAAGRGRFRAQPRRAVLLGRVRARGACCSMSLGSVESETPQSVQPVETNRALEDAALRRDRAGFVKLLESALGLSHRTGRAHRRRSIRRAAAGRRQGAGDAVGRAAARADVPRSGDRRVGRPRSSISRRCTRR